MDVMQLTEARNKLSEMVRRVQDKPIWILRHSQPVAVLVSPARYEALLDEIEDLKDRLSIYESEASSSDMRIPLDKMKIELGMGHI